MIAYVAAALLGLGSTAYASIAKTCPSTNVCYSLNIPDTTASSGSGDIYFQLSAPTTYSWVSLGQGSRMAGSNMFVLYTNKAGTNVTLSPRLGTGHAEPNYNSAAKVTLLDGTGVSNGIMTANVKCSNCQSWSGGSMDFTSSSGSWIYAGQSGSPLNSDDTSASISQHGSQGSFSFDFSKAKGGSDLNPFTAASATAGSSGSGSAATSCGGQSTGTAASQTTAGSSGSSTAGSGNYPWTSGRPTDWQGGRPTNYPGGFPFSGSSWPTSQPTNAPWADKRAADTSCTDRSSSSSSTSSNGALFGSTNGFGGGFFNFQGRTRVLLAHGVIAALAFVVLFPLGAISIRVLSFPGLIWLHAAFQVLAYVLYIIAFGIGIYMATNLQMLDAAHVIIGIALFVLLFFQPVLGILHHKMFKKYSRRTAWSYGHIWLGRIVISLGIVNGGLGLQLAGNTTNGQRIAYAVIAAIFWLAYVAAIVYGELKRKRNAPPPYSKEMPLRSIDSSPNREYYGKPSGTRAYPSV